MKKNKLIKLNNNKGQTLIMLLVFMVVAIIITTSATIVLIVNSQSTTKLEQGMMAYISAESAIENALLRLLRNPSYNGETLNIADTTTIATVSGTNPIIITSTGYSFNAFRKIEAQASYVNNILTVSSWKEIP